ncbi:MULTISPECIES: glycoside hydrolase family 95-like protein [unclassified Crossiella]|uniref:glycosyl hydrolase family 95 catalytic domain-containing protein n=1 Tax=unclassified Crossiella TaxID=2620835 RepID=UPI001FFF4B9B|nr:MULTISPECIES: twin-arginine translocation signal domain-containing protein [unclassified Crossiella]MCK2240245.1 twin-arginine translocation signal domain-containing protein [Crossiella sp. S99.2]MCK2253303.1 twin-arginine translocation signal domain-containing protein [Crossiella sp. S99.1]
MDEQRWDLSRRTFLAATAAAGVVGAAAPSATAAPVENPAPEPGIAGLSEVDWAKFLGAQDPVWKKLPAEWWQGPFLGDGRLGSIIRKEPGKNAIRFSVQHAEVQDHRPQFGSGHGVCRLPVGHLTLEPAGTITGVDWRLDLWHGEFTGTITTSAGTLKVRAFIHTTRSVLLAQVTPGGGERVRWVFHPEPAVSTRPDPPSGYTPNPEPVRGTNGAEQVVRQEMLAGGQTATAYRDPAWTSGEHTLLLAVAHSFPARTAEAEALKLVRDAADLGVAALVASHREWWHAFYRKSFVSLPDQRLQSFWWIQLYKTATGTRAGGTVMATCGPWFEPTGWPAVWWNLNVQLEYWLIHGSNHVELDAITSTLRDNQAQLIKNVRPEYQHDSAGVGRSTDRTTLKGSYVARPGDGGGSPETGNLTWTLHNVWLTYRHTMDISILRDTIFPILRRSINYYLHFLKPGGDGKLHLPETHSPEYGNAPDCNYDLALIRWGCRTLLYANDKLGKNDPLASKWRQVLRDLVPYPTDKNGFMIGAGVPYEKSHRHYSHLLMVYPLYEITGDDPAQRTLIDTSIKHWHAIQGAHRGYSYTGAASMLAGLGRGDEALAYLLKFFDPSTRYPVTENTMYREGSPVVETPLSAAQSLHDMLVQSWGEFIRIFPAVPRGWADVTVDKFLTEGAFEISAVRKGGRTRWVSVHSTAGSPCKVRHGIQRPIQVSRPDGSPVVFRELPGGVVEFDLARGGTAVIYPQGAMPELTIEPVRISNPGKPWGLS